MTTRPLYLKQLELGPMQNFIYLLGDPASREAAVVDPGWEVPTILKTLEQDGYRLTRIFVTHSHFDHVMGLPALLSKHDLPVYVNRDEAASLDVDPSVLKPVDSGEIIHVGDVPIRLIHTPGHTPGSQCLLIDDQLFSGDTLFIRACGRCDLPGGDPEALYNSLTQTLKKLDDQTVLLPGHNYADVPTSTIGQEKQSNPFMQLETVEQFRKLVGL